MEKFSFFHISDLHLSKKLEGWVNPYSCQHLTLMNKYMARTFAGTRMLHPSTYKENVAISLYQFLLQRTDQVDALIVTGDLACTGSDGDLIAAKDYFMGRAGIVWNNKTKNKVGEEIFEPLIGSELPIIMMPGNHDRYKQMIEFYKPRSMNYEKYFEDNWSLASEQKKSLPLEKKNGGIEFIGADNTIKRIVFEKGLEKIILYCMDFSLREAEDCLDSDSSAYLGHGFVYGDIIKDVEKDMKLIERDNILVAWAIHFSPKSQDETLTLYFSGILLKKARKLNVGLLMCGHVHSQDNYKDKGLHVFCAGTACSAEYNIGDANIFWDIELEIHNGKILNVNESKKVEFDIDDGFRIV